MQRTRVMVSVAVIYSRSVLLVYSLAERRPARMPRSRDVGDSAMSCAELFSECAVESRSCARCVRSKLLETNSTSWTTVQVRMKT